MLSWGVNKTEADEKVEICIILLVKTKTRGSAALRDGAAQGQRELHSDRRNEATDQTRIRVSKQKGPDIDPTAVWGSLHPACP